METFRFKIGLVFHKTPMSSTLTTWKILTNFELVKCGLDIIFKIENNFTLKLYPFSMRSQICVGGPQKLYF